MYLSSCTILVSCIVVLSYQFLLLLLVYEKTKKKKKVVYMVVHFACFTCLCSSYSEILLANNINKAW